MPNGLRVFVGDLGGLPTDFAQRLGQQGFAVTGVAKQEGLLTVVRDQSEADVIVLFAPCVDDGVLDMIRKLATEPGKPIVMFCEEADRAAIEAAVSAGVNAYAVTGVTASRVQAAINLALANHRCTSGLKEELDEAKQALQDRRVIERAKGIVMTRCGLDEAGAYRLLRTRAMQRGMRLVDVARALADADDLLG